MKRIEKETLYEAMGGIGDDLLLRSEEPVRAVPGRTSAVRFRKRVLLGVACAAALVMAALLAQNMLRFRYGGAPEAGNADMAAPASGIQTTPASGVEETPAQAMEEAAKADTPDADSQAFRETGKMTAESAPATESVTLQTQNAEEEGEALTEDRDTASPDAPAFFVYDGTVYTERAHDAAEEVKAGVYVATIKKHTADRTADETYRDKTGTIGGDVYTVAGKDPSKVLCMKEEDGTVRLFFSPGE